MIKSIIVPDDGMSGTYNRNETLIAELIPPTETKDYHVYFIITNQGALVRRLCSHPSGLVVMADCDAGQTQYIIKPADILELWEIKGKVNRAYQVPAVI